MNYTDNREVFEWNKETSRGIPYVSFRMLDELGYPNLYTTRYKSWNDEMGAGSGSAEDAGETGLRVAYMKGEDVDEARAVISGNLGALAVQLGSDLDHLVVTHQLHTANVMCARAEDLGYWKSVARYSAGAAGAAGIDAAADSRIADPGIDGIVTNVPNACLIVYGADCPSIYLVDPVNHAIGLVHAGWKGTFGKIPEVAIKMMVEEFGSNPVDMYAAIGPSICEDCYEMGDEIYDRLATEWSKEDADLLMKRHPSVVAGDGAEDAGLGKYHLDLWKANRLTLERAGIPADHIEVTNICTCCNADDFYSYRAHRMENEQAAMLVNR